MTEDEKIIERLTPEEGWWRASTEDAVADIITTMCEHDMSSDLVEELVGTLIGALRSEYGD